MLEIACAEALFSFVFQAILQQLIRCPHANCSGSLVALSRPSPTHTEEWELLPFESNYKQLNYFLHKAELGLSRCLKRKQMCTSVGMTRPVMLNTGTLPCSKKKAPCLKPDFWCLRLGRTSSRDRNISVMCRGPWLGLQTSAVMSTALLRQEQEMVLSPGTQGILTAG